MTPTSARAPRARAADDAVDARARAAGGSATPHPASVPRARGERAPWGFVAAATAGFAGVALATIARHEFWRDEVRAFSLATRTPSLAALFDELHYEGHPALWFLLLRAAHALVPSTVVLPAVAFLAGVAAIALFLRAAPFGRGEKLLFAFGVVPLYDHTVMARNYGIGMLALFAWAAAWPSRHERGWAVGLALACLANTHVPALLVAGALLGAWMLDAWQRRRTTRFGAGAALGMAIAGAGIVAAVLTVRPAPDLGTVAPEAGSVLARVAHALPAFVNPGAYFLDLLGLVRGTLGDGPVGRLAPYAAMLALDLFLLALAVGAWMQGGPFRLVLPAVIGGLTMLFAAVYRGSLRHQAVVVLLALALEWVRRVERARGRAPEGAPQRGGAALVHGALLALFVVHLARGAWNVGVDLRGERTPMPRLAAWLDAQPELARAAVVAEPGFYADALPYYSARPLYFPRERRWGEWASWRRLADSSLTLDELRLQVRAAERASGRPVVVLLGHPELRTRDASDPQPEIGGAFTWTPEQRRAWNAEMELRGAFLGASTENVLLYTRRAGAAR